MNIEYGMDKQDWKELLDTLRETEGIILNYYPETDDKGYFIDFKYVTFECHGMFFYMDGSNFEFTICAYQKVSPYERRQIDYPEEVNSFEGIMNYVNRVRRIHPISYTYNQRIYLTDLYGLSNGTTTLWKLRNELAGNREKAILANLEHIEMVRNSGGYKVLRFWHKDGKEWFDYECNSKRITG